MGKGSNDPILNRQMPRRGVVIIPDSIRIAENQPCRDEEELRACRNAMKIIENLIQDLAKDKLELQTAWKILEKKSDEYLANFKKRDNNDFRDDWEESDLEGI